MTIRRVLAMMLGMCLVGARAEAQSPLRVLRFSPTDSGSAGSIVTVMFDRPVAPELERSIGARKVLRVSPSIAGTIEWRDPSTVQFVPNDPFAPATKFVVSVDTAAAASRGQRTGRAQEYRVRIPGTRLIAHAVDKGNNFTAIVPVPTMQLVFSGAVNVDTIVKYSRMEFPECRKTITFRSIGQRPAKRQEFGNFHKLEKAPPDTVGDRFIRMVELQAIDSVPSSCVGVMHFVDPANGERPNELIQQRVVGYWPFVVAEVRPCLVLSRPCEPNGLTVAFSTPVSPEFRKRSIQVPAGFNIASSGELASYAAFPGKLVAGRQYTVSIDTSIRDMLGRRLEGKNTFTVTAGNRSAGILQQLGPATIPLRTGDAPSIQVRTVNVDTLDVTIVLVPDSLAPAFVAPRERFQTFKDAQPALTDTLKFSFAAGGELDVEHDVRIPIPRAFVSQLRNRVFGIRVDIGTRMGPPDSVAFFNERSKHRFEDRASSARSRAAYLARSPDMAWSFSVPDLVITQFSSLQAHLKIDRDAGGVFVTDLAGAPVEGASARLVNDRYEVIADGISNRDGLVALRQRPGVIVKEDSAKFPKVPSGGSRVVEITHKNDRLLVPLNYAGDGWWTRSQALNSYGNNTAPLVRSALITDRVLYRPGEVLYSKITVRDGMPGIGTTPVSDSVRVSMFGTIAWDPTRGTTASGPLGDTISLWQGRLGEFGSAADSALVPARARLGAYAVHAERLQNGRWYTLARVPIRVEEYRPVDFLVTAQADTAARIVGTPVPVYVEANYMFGAPMANAIVDWSANTVPFARVQRAIPNTAGYGFGITPVWMGSLTAKFPPITGTDTLDANGRKTIAVKTAGAQLLGPSIVEISTSVRDRTNQTVTANTLSYLYATDIHIGARFRTATNSLKRGEEQVFDIIAVHSNGKRVAGLPVLVRVLRRIDQPDINRLTWDHWKYDTVNVFNVVSTADSLPIRFLPPRAGLYQLRMDVTDSLGRPTQTMIDATITEPAPVVAAAPPSPNIKVDRANATYSLGEVAQVSFTSPFRQADAWITYEHNGIIDQSRKLVAAGATTLRIPVDERFAPNAWISVTLINKQQGDLTVLDTVSNMARTYSAEIKVDTTARMLLVNVQPQKSVTAPGDSVQVQIRVHEAGKVDTAKGVRSEVALWAVDEGVLALTGYKLPDIRRIIDPLSRSPVGFASSLASWPWSKPNGAVGVGTTLRDVTNPYAVLASSQFSMSGSDIFINTLSFAEGDLRAAFRSTAFFFGKVVTDNNGTATISARMPDNLTTFRLMATAVTAGNRFGSGEASLMATRSIVLHTALPRFVRPGDSLDALAMLNTRDGVLRNLTVSFDAANGRFPLAKSTTSVHATAASEKIQFRLAIPERTATDVTSVTFAARDQQGAVADAVQISLPIKPAGTPRSRTIVGMVRDSGTVTMMLPADIDPARSTMSLGLGSSPVVAMRSHYERLRSYRFNSTDLIVAKAQALLSLSRAERALNDPLVTRDSQSVREELQRAVDEVVQRQSPGGSFLFFIGSDNLSDGWITGAGVRFLLDAKREGLRVPASTIPRAEQSMLSRTRFNENSKLDTLNGTMLERRARRQAYRGEQVVMVRLFRDVGRPITSLEDMLFNALNEMTWEDRLGVVEIMSQRPDRSARAAQLLEELWKGVSLAGKRLDFPDSLRSSSPYASRVRPAARLMTATMKMNPSHPLLGALGETLIQQHNADPTWAWNSLDFSAAIEALAELAGKHRGATAVRLVARDRNGRMVVSRNTQSTGAQSVVDSAISLTGLTVARNDSARLSLALRVESDGGLHQLPLYYAITVNEIPKTRPVTPDVAGIVIERWYERFDDGAPIIEATVGEVIRARIRITVPADRQFVAIEDLLPAGLEAVDLSLSSSSTITPNAQTNAVQRVANERRPDTDAYGSVWDHKESRDDRVFYFARRLPAGSYQASYLARATTSGTFVRPPAHAEEMYNAAVQGRSDGGVFIVRPR